jgi:hypothetical protein
VENPTWTDVNHAKPQGASPSQYRETAMAEDKELESLAGIEQDVQITERINHAMENYFGWFQNAMSASQWSNIDLHKRLMSYATDNVTASVGVLEKLSRAKTLEEVVKIQAEFMSSRQIPL